MSLRERIRSVFRLFLLFTVLVAVALLSFIFTVRLAIRGRQFAAPKFVGMPFERAQRAANDMGLQLKVEDKLYNPQFPVNQVVSQMPPPGTRVKVGQHVHVLVSLGRPQVAVPTVVGSSLRAARITAIERGLTVGDIAAVHWPDSEADQVVAQDPPPATNDVRTPTLNFIVSIGEPSAAYLCTSFIGRPIAEIRRKLEQAGFQVEHVSWVSASASPSGTILAQSPPPGARIGLDTSFSFQVAR